eukprot:m.539151 g.539151  ORF g.539151 m.539151 type:complete len:58 (-) comp22088_c0_seq9:1050-1223(-)
MRSAALITGNVKVIRPGGGFGEFVIDATKTSSTSSSGCSGNKDAVCPVAFKQGEKLL